MIMKRLKLAIVSLLIKLKSYANGIAKIKRLRVWITTRMSMMISKKSLSKQQINTAINGRRSTCSLMMELRLNHFTYGTIYAMACSHLMDS